MRVRGALPLGSSRPSLFVLGLLVYALWAGVEGLVTWLALLGSAFFGGLVLFLQIMRRSQWVERTSRLTWRANWLQSADVADILEYAEQLHTWWFGEQVISRRALRVSMLLSTVPIVTVGLFWTTPYLFAQLYYQGRPLDHVLSVAAMAFNGALLASLPMFVGNVLFDYASLIVTRTILRHLRQDPTTPRLVLGFAVDALAFFVFGMLGVCSNLLGVWFFGP